MSTVDFRILNYNYAFQDNVEISASSENAEFPATNTGHFFRSRVWRSSGHYRINTSNNKIDFKETGGGPEITATLTTGDYTPSSLCTEIKTRMDAATLNARVYTVTFSSTTGKFTIAGSTFLSILFSTGTNAATSVRTAIGFGANDYTGNTTYTGVDTSIHTDERVVFDLESSEEVDSVALLFDPRVGIKFSDQALIYFEANPSNNWDSPAYSQALTIDNESDIATLFLTTAIEYRYYSIKIVDPENPFLYVELGTVILGKKAELTRCPDTGFEFKVEDQSKIESNQYGHEYVDEYPLQRSLSIAMNILDVDQQEQLEDIFTEVGVRTPVLIVLDAQEALFDKDRFTIYGRFQKAFSFNNIVRDYFGSSFTITETF